MKLLTLAPLLGVNIPTSFIGLGMKLLSKPGVVTDSGAIDIDAALKLLPELVRSDPELAKAIVKIGLKGLGVSEAAAELGVSYAYDTNGERSEEELESFVSQFKYLNSPEGRIKLPFGCKECKRVHYQPSDVHLSDTGNPICVRCGRQIKLIN